MPTYNGLPKPSEFFKGKWYNKLVEDLRLAGMAKRTVYGYVRAIRKLADFHQKSPDKLSENDLRQYLLHQIVDLEVAAGTQSVLLWGIKSFIWTAYTLGLRIGEAINLQVGDVDGERMIEVVTKE